MISSMRLLLENFLGLMREEGELDVFLPLLLSGMRHEIVYRAHRGVRQHGVDIASTGPGEKGRKTLFLWLVKCGQIGRTEWSGGNQAVRQSIEDVETYLRSHRLPQHQHLPVKLVVITNGDYTPHIAETAAGYLESWGVRNSAATQLVNGSMLAAWTEEYLLDENVLPVEARAQFRRVLANINTPELAIDAGQQLIHQLLHEPDLSGKSKNAIRKHHLGALRAVRTAVSVVQHWAASEGNLTVPYRLAEFAVLRVWTQYHEQLRTPNVEIENEYRQILSLLLHCAGEYHGKLQPLYVVEGAFAAQQGNNLLVCDSVLTELGRMGLIGIICARLAHDENDDGAYMHFVYYLQHVEALLGTHPISGSPCWDHHALSIHSALILLAIGEKYVPAKKWVEQLILRLHLIVGDQSHWPLTCSFEDALAIREGGEEVSPEFVNTSTMVPVLLLWAAALKMDEAFRFLVDRVVPQMTGVSLNMWSSDEGFDDVVAFPSKLSAHGIGEILQSFAASPEDFLNSMAPPLPGVESISDSAWFNLGAAYIPLLAGLHWNLQAPREMLVQHILAVVGRLSDTQD